MDAATIGAVATIVAGLAAAAAAVIGQRSNARATHQGVVMSGYGGLVDQLQEERDKLESKLRDTETLLAAAYADLAGERANKAELQAQIARLQAEIADLHRQLAALGGPTP